MFHKNLATSRYDEFLASSDDESYFKTKPGAKDTRNYQLDFKIDTYRDEIKLNKNGSQTKIIGSSLGDKTILDQINSSRETSPVKYDN